ncbi:MAG TPA: hypothetical protein VHR55_13205 [Candidatus Limnocylindria bacterium]|nr:hypothetical protein [Candidatus Limnocylindria bacterium]
MFRLSSTLLLAVLLAACGQGASESTSASAEASEAATADASAGSSAAAGDTIEVTAVDYAFAGIPSEVESGTSFELTNEGSEVHELVLVRRNDDVDLTFEELLELPEDEAMELVTIVGGIVAEPGATSEDTLTVDEPGDYLAICFVATGTTSLEDAESVEGAPHFAEGMLQEFTVTD